MSDHNMIIQPMKPKVIKEEIKFLIITGFVLVYTMLAFAFHSPIEIWEGLIEILRSPSVLVTDYMKIGNIGAAFFNSGIMMLLTILCAFVNKVQMNGSLIAVIFTMGGFALFGKNVYNSFSIVLGVYIHALIQKEKFSKYIIIAFFGTALAPLVSQISFYPVLPPVVNIIIGNVAGFVAGLVLPPLARHFLKFHQGFSLYNIGFTCGLIGTLFMSLFRAFGRSSEITVSVSSGNNRIFAIIFITLFAILIIIGFILNNYSFKNYIRLFRHSGRLVQDFVYLDGFQITLINMGVLGILMTSIILLVQGELNGPTIGGILTVVGFGAFGKHPKNVLPIVIGVFIAAYLQVWEFNSTSVLLAALFGTTLAPIAGRFGPVIGIIAGFIHLTIVMNVGDLHGGLNLYNNGFSGGLVAATLVPVIEAFRKDEES